MPEPEIRHRNEPVEEQQPNAAATQPLVAPATVHPFEKLKRFEMALEMRNMEIHLLWERSNYFLALNTAIAVAFFSVSQEKSGLLVALSFFGLLCSALWVCVNLGSKFWQARWEEKLREEEMALGDNINFFTQGYSSITESVRNNLRRQNGGRQTLIEKLILRKPSVSTQVIYLAFGFALFWAIMILTRISEWLLLEVQWSAYSF